MGWSIQTNNVDNWKIVSSVVDDVIAEFNNEHDLKVWFAKQKIYDGKLKAIEMMMVFPNQWNVNDERKLNRDGMKNYTNWLEEMYEAEDGYKVIDDKLEELLKSN